MTDVKKESILIGLYKGTWDQRDFERFQIWDIKYPIVFLTDEPFRDVTHIFSFAHHIPRRIKKLAQKRNIKIYTFTNKSLPYRSNWKTWLLELITPPLINPVVIRLGDDLLAVDNIITDNTIGWVFVDQNMCQDSEEIGRMDIQHLREQYVKDVLTFLGKFDVITIAGHPRNTDTHLGKYPIRHGITSDLIKKSKGVISHYSTSIKFAARCNKPIIILSTPDLDESVYSRYIHGFANQLHLRVHYPNDEPDISQTVSYTVEENDGMTTPDTIESIVEGGGL